MNDLTDNEPTEKPTQHQTRPPVVGLALGSGSARGWAHIGVIQELETMGVHPQIITGTSIGALVGAVHVSGQLDAFSEWVQSLSVRDVIRLLDIRFAGGVINGEKLFSYFKDDYYDPDIESLTLRYASVVTDMESGREKWITRGPVLAAARASCAMPGVFSPVCHEGRRMLDGGLVNPVPVSVARAMGADVTIAVNLNAQLTGPHMARIGRRAASEIEKGEDPGLWQRMMKTLSSDDEPTLFDVIAASVNIMQDRITRSRMAGDPPEVTLNPALGELTFMDFHRADEAIEEGRRIVRVWRDEILGWLH